MALNGFDGNGNFLRTFPEGGWKGDATAGIKIRADRHDDHDQALANALSNMICKDGQTTVLADIPFNGKKITGLGAPTAPTDAVNKAYADSVNTFTTGANISGADLNGRLTFSSPTGANGLAWTGADLSWIARLATAAGPGTPPVPPATINRLVLNDKADGTGTDVVEVREDGSIKAATITATPTVNVKGTAGNVHLWFKGPADEDRGVIYTDAATAGHMYLRVNGTQTFTFDNAGGFTAPGGAAVGGGLTVSSTIYAGGVITAAGTINALGGQMAMGNGGAGRVMMFASQWYWDWNSGNGHLYYQTPAGRWITLDGNLTIVGNAYKPGGGSWLNGSDIRIKDVEGDYTNGLDRLKGLQPKTYRLKGNDQPPEGGMAPVDTDRVYVGLIAQEAETVMPSLVEQRPGWIDGQEVPDFRVIDTSELIYTLINAVKELSARIEVLEAK